MALCRITAYFYDNISYHYYSGIVKKWVRKIGLDLTQYNSHSLRIMEASLIYAKAKNLQAIQLLQGYCQFIELSRLNTVKHTLA
ncbi:site-specific integrase [Psychromonas ingrahamii]|uniref:hypothetical protein n=1 Tax=Psychromonas ingrahamii TaxID=357794 RepID=UPI0000D80D33|nr:hypothetical protein [Psychromonas ingrahamii]